MVERQTSFERSLGDREKYCDLIIPKEPDGAIMYETLGKILTAKSLEEVLCASYVDPRYGRKLDIPGIPDTEWEYMTVTDDVVILRKYNHKTKINCFMGRGLVDAPMKEVQNYISNLVTRYDYDPMITEIKVLRHLSNTDYIVYMAHHVEKFWGILHSQRDSCYFNRQVMKDGAYIQTSISVEDELCPEKPGYTRMELLPGCGWVLEPYPSDPSKTIVSYLAHMNLGGLMPSMLVNIVLKKQPLVVARIRDIFDRKNKGTYKPQWPNAVAEDSLGNTYERHVTSGSLENGNEDVLQSSSTNQKPLYREPLIFDSSESDHADLNKFHRNNPAAHTLVDIPAAHTMVESEETRSIERTISEPIEDNSLSFFKRVSSWIWKSPVSSEPRLAKGYNVQPLPVSIDSLPSGSDSDEENGEASLNDTPKSISPTHS